jgi:hypothetical protein
MFSKKIIIFAHRYTKTNKDMISFIIWIIGVVLCIKAVLEILSLPGDMTKQLLCIVILLLTSWVGLVVYYFWAREQVGQWVK